MTEPMTEALTEALTEPVTEPGAETTASTRPVVDHEVVVVGAGFGGIGQAIALKRAGIHDFVLLEKASGVGGTWRENVYPGVACDVPSHLYSFSFEPNPGWSREYATGEEIRAYLQHCVVKYYVEPHLRLDTMLVGARLDQSSGVWTLSLATGDGGSYELTCRSLVLALGALHVPAFPDIPGLGDFPGPVMHTGAWDSSVSLAGKRVAVVGTGASAVQVVPQLAGTAAHLTVFQRTPPWILPKHDAGISSGRRGLFARFPSLMSGKRVLLFWRMESAVVGFTRLPRLMRLAEQQARSHLQSQVTDPVLRAALTPTDLIGCRRVVLASDYYPVFARNDVTLQTGPIQRVDGNALVTPAGAVEVDAVVLATGFVLNGSYRHVEVLGADGHALHEQWARDQQAYYGVMVDGFPNLFTVLGPNSGLGHTSLLLISEAQNRMVVQAIRERDRRRAGSIQVRTAAQDQFNGRVQQRSRRAVWLSGCRSWYLDQDGVNRALWPWSTLAFRRRTRVLHTDDFWFGQLRP